ncbi:hypothetical protein [Shewanella marisflavi]|uniref:hypothetical protein n=1 Tax=Shewanella marisflavi TaxID=260364 RepID=UPI003AB01DFD
MTPFTKVKDIDVRRRERDLFAALISQCGLTIPEYDNLVSLGTGESKTISKKLRDPELASSRAITKSDILSAQFAVLLVSLGADPKSFEFSPDGLIRSVRVGGKRFGFSHDPNYQPFETLRVEQLQDQDTLKQLYQACHLTKL